MTRSSKCSSNNILSLAYFCRIQILCICPSLHMKKHQWELPPINSMLFVLSHVSTVTRFQHGLSTLIQLSQNNPKLDPSKTVMGTLTCKYDLRQANHGCYMLHVDSFLFKTRSWVKACKLKLWLVGHGFSYCWCRSILLQAAVTSKGMCKLGHP